MGNCGIRGKNRLQCRNYRRFGPDSKTTRGDKSVTKPSCSEVKREKTRPLGRRGRKESVIEMEVTTGGALSGLVEEPISSGDSRMALGGGSLSPPAVLAQP